jgi:hypothetical protein
MEQNRAPIIVSARKVAAALANAIACFGEQNPSATAVSTPPLKSVIVRAGPGPTTTSVRPAPIVCVASSNSINNEFDEEFFGL